MTPPRAPPSTLGWTLVLLSPLHGGDRLSDQVLDLVPVEQLDVHEVGAELLEGLVALACMHACTYVRQADRNGGTREIDDQEGGEGG